MKKYILKGFLLLATAVSITACSDDDKLNAESILPKGEIDNTPEGQFLEKTFRQPYGIKVNYKWDRNLYGVGRDPLRNLYPPLRSNVIPAMDMVNNVWIQSYVEIAGSEFVTKIRPLEFVLAGGPALNNDNTRTLGLATAGARVTLYELDYVVADPDYAQQFIHTIQHEYIHIINMKAEFNELEFGAQTVASYTPNWYEHTDVESNKVGFVTSYARSNIFEDFAETASYMLTHTKAEYDALLAGLIASDNQDAANKIEYKVGKVRDYFKEFFDVDFDALCEVANRNAANSNLLNNGTVSPKPADDNGTFGLKVLNDGQTYLHSCEFHTGHKNIDK